MDKIKHQIVIQYVVSTNTWQDYLAHDCVTSLISDSEDLAQRFYSFSHALRGKKKKDIDGLW